MKYIKFLSILAVLVPSHVLAQSCPTLRDGAGGCLYKWSERSGIVALFPERYGNQPTSLCSGVRCVPLTYSGLGNADARGLRHHYRYPLRGVPLARRLGVDVSEVDRRGYFSRGNCKIVVEDVLHPRID